MSGTISHEWNGTVLTVTSDSGTSSADLKGEKGDDGARGAQGATLVKSVNGKQGEVKLTAGDVNALPSGELVKVEQGGTGKNSIDGVMELVNNSYNRSTISIETTDIFTLLPGIYHAEQSVTTEQNYPIAGSKILIEVLGQHRRDYIAPDGYSFGYWAIRVTYCATGAQYINTRSWNAWKGWKQITTTAI